jgi:hypothetical protein
MEENGSFRFVTIKKFADQTGIPVFSIREMVKSGVIPGSKLGKRYMIDTVEAEKILQEHGI